MCAFCRSRPDDVQAHPRQQVSVRGTERSCANHRAGRPDRPGRTRFCLNGSLVAGDFCSGAANDPQIASVHSRPWLQAGRSERRGSGDRC
jgi:hypothetical protein